MIEVMWIDDEWEDKGLPFIMSAENEGINIAPFDTYAKGLMALETITEDGKIKISNKNTDWFEFIQKKKYRN